MLTWANRIIFRYKGSKKSFHCVYKYHKSFYRNMIVGIFRLSMDITLETRSLVCMICISLARAENRLSRHASLLRGAGTRDERLRTSVWEASFVCAETVLCNQMEIKG